MQLTLLCWIYFRKRNVFTFSAISQDWDDSGSWTPSWWRTRTCGCWCPGDARSQGFNSHGIEMVCPEYSDLSTKRVDFVGTNSSLRFLYIAHHNYCRFLHDWPWISPWIKSIFNELDITNHVIASQLSGYCDVIRNRLWRYQQNETERVRHGDDV